MPKSSDFCLKVVTTQKWVKKCLKVVTNLIFSRIIVKLWPKVMKNDCPINVKSIIFCKNRFTQKRRNFKNENFEIF